VLNPKQFCAVQNDKARTNEGKSKGTQTHQQEWQVQLPATWCRSISILWVMIVHLQPLPSFWTSVYFCVC